MNSSLRPDLPFNGDKLRCFLSDPTDAEPHFLRLRLGPPLPSSGCYDCGQYDSFKGLAYHWYCKTCDVQFHDGCHHWPRKMRHPYHLQHLLSFSFFRPNRTLVSPGNYREYNNLDYPNTEIKGKCNWCDNYLQVIVPFYRCSLCGFTMCWSCSKKDVRLTIENLKTHPHPVTFFPRPLSPCDACGLANANDSTYTCHQCLYVVHQNCLLLPRLIKITRHPHHRLSRVPYLSPTENRSCGVCHRRVDPQYGAYSCTSGCPYTLHSKCATRFDVWDGKELEVEAEEPDETKDIEPFVEIDEKVIIHFSHPQHPLHLIDFNGGVREANKQCEACVLPIDSGSFYNCTQCDFFLHTVCASLPRKIYHELHRHPLFLDPRPEPDFHSLSCSACLRATTGFRYKCNEKNCFEKFKIDLRCASSISDPVVHNLHKHSLFIDSRNDGLDTCRLCGKLGYGSIGYVLRCFEDGCNFVMCLKCGTLPHEIRYKYDAHCLTLCYEESRSDIYWCEVCEKKLNSKDKMFYTCHECCTTLHVGCIYPPSIFMKAGHSFIFHEDTIEVFSNGSSTRPICDGCSDRCQGNIFYKMNDGYFCSLNCFCLVKERYKSNELSFKALMLISSGL